MPQLIEPTTPDESPPSRIVTARRPKPVRLPKPEPVARIVYSPSAKTLAAIRRWERLTGRTMKRMILCVAALLPSPPQGSGPNDGLLGFSGSTVTVRFGSIIYTYDEKGKTLYAKAA
jgi:hypothetical protein